MARVVTRRALDASLEHRIRPCGPEGPLRWLASGWRDLTRCPGPGLLHGAVLAGFGLLLGVFGYRHFWGLAGAFSGFLLVAPLLATGLYAISAALERGERASLQTALQAWRPRSGDARRVVFGVLLALAGTGWVLTSASLITHFAGGPVHEPRDFLMRVVLAERGWLFEAWLVLGGVLAAPVFASSVVAIPMLMDRPVGILAAVLTSWRVVLAQPVTMALWAATIALLTLVGMATAMIGLILVVPWLGHASWHAYRALVETPAVTRAG
jgi:uncharacterized membrane protein